MPQLSQLSQVYLSQFLWLAVALAFIFFVVARGMVPKIQATVEAREKKIASDLEEVRRARDAAEKAEAAYREKMDASRSEAMRLAQEAKQSGAREAEKRVAAASRDIDDKLAAAETKIRDLAAAAQSEIEGVAVEATRDIFAKLTGKTVPAAEATRAVKAVIHG
jgi:F-type H+-transporting ATPase subunit b